MRKNFGVGQDKEGPTFGIKRPETLGNFVIGRVLLSSVRQRRSTAGRRLATEVALVVVIACAGVGAPSTKLRLNISRSMPRGLYWIVDADMIERGAVVAACLPPRIAEVGRARRYIGPGSCGDGSEAIVKHVVGIPGDVVTVGEDAVVVQGTRLPNSGTAAVDSRGVTLEHPPFGAFKIARGEVWLFSSAPRSWDSRYFGPVGVDRVVGVAKPLLTIG